MLSSNVDNRFDDEKDNKFWSQLRNYAIGTGVILGAGTVMFAMARYKVARASEYVVRTGPFIQGVSIQKKAFQWPFQTYATVEMKPYNYSFKLSAMSREKMEFRLPGVFTIGPRDDPEALKRYSILLGDKKLEKIDEIIEGVIEGETRVLSAAMEIEEIFNDRDAFKVQIIERVQKELDQFGLIIYNANIKELEDTEGSEYFV